MLKKIVFTAISIPTLLFSQTPQPGQLVSDERAEGVDTRGLTVGQKLRYDAIHVFDVDNFVYAGLGAAIDQWRDRPGQWGQGWDAFSHRYASHIGQYFVQRAIMSPVQALDHEDTRFFRSSHKNYAVRAADAFLQTVWCPNSQGKMMPAYGEFIGDYGAAAVSRLWWPDQYRNGKAIFVAGTNTVLIDGGISVLHEFTPDIKRWLHIGH
jgi:hypothetical protein